LVIQFVSKSQSKHKQWAGNQNFDVNVVTYPSRLFESTEQSREHLLWTAYTGWFRNEGNILIGNSIGRSEKIIVWTCLISNGYRDGAAWISTSTCIIFSFLALDEEWSLQKNYGCMRRTARSDFGCCSPHEATWRSTETNNTRSSHTSCKVHWGWRWDFRTFIVNCNKFVI
jgi:hypothetical protein